MQKRSGCTISVILVHPEDVRAVIDFEQQVGSNYDAIELRELIATIRGAWLIEDGSRYRSIRRTERSVILVFWHVKKRRHWFRAHPWLDRGYRGWSVHIFSTCVSIM
jgi:hypothetical protein